MLDLDKLTDQQRALLSDERKLKQLPADKLAVLLWQVKWASTVRDKQRPPEGDWTEWGLLAGRGFGKTLTGAQWLAHETYFDPMAYPSHVIAPTLNDVRHTCFEGPAGLLAILPPEIVKDYNKTNLIITIETVDGKKNTIRGFSAEEPERLRGVQCARQWCDELAAWTFGEETWDMAMMGLRMGRHTQTVWTTTPKPKEIVRKLVVPKKGRVITTGSTYENRAHLAPSFFDQLVQYEGTQLGRQELEGELIDMEEGGVVSRSDFRLWPAHKPLPPFDLIIMSLDTAFTEKTIDKRSHDPDSSACVVGGVFWHEDIRQLLILDCWAEQLGLPDLIRKVKKEKEVCYGDDQDVAIIKPMYGAGRPGSSGRKPDILVIEDKGSGISLRQMLEREGITTHSYNPGRADKLTRLHIVSPVFARKQVWLPESQKHPGKPMTWVEPMVAQICSFRGSGSIKHDDYVDALTQMTRICIDKGFMTIAKRKKPGVNEDKPEKKKVVNPYAA